MSDVQERMILPPSDDQARDQLAELAEAISAATPEVLGERGRRIALSGAVRDALAQVVASLRAGNAVAVGPYPTRLTTQQAADLLGVSRPTLIKMLDDGKLPYERPSGHRRLRLADVLAYRERQRAQRAHAMTALVQHNEDAGMYEEGEP